MEHKTHNSKSSKSRIKMTTLLLLCLFSPTILADNVNPPLINPEIIDYICKYTEPERPAIESAAYGEIVISCNILTNGKTTNATIKYRVLERLDNEALSLIRNMPQWSPATINGKKVNASVQIGVKFFPTRVRVISWNAIQEKESRGSTALNTSNPKMSNTRHSSGNTQKNYFEKEKRYIINSQSRLNIRDFYSQNSNIIGKLNPGESVDVYGVINNWAIIKYEGKEAYISSDYITPAVSTRISNNNSHNIFNYILYVIAILFILQVVWGIIDDIPSFLLFSNIIVLPILTILYARYSDNSMWFCHPSRVGWFFTIVNVFILIMYLGYFWGIIKESFMGVLSIFKGEIISPIICLIVLLVYISATSALLQTAFNELMIVGIIMLLGAIPSSQFVGTFTDNAGNKWNVYKY